MRRDTRWLYGPERTEPDPDYVNIVIFGAVAIVSSMIVTAFLRTVGFEILDVSRSFGPLESGTTAVGVAAAFAFGATVVYAWLAAREINPRPRFYSIGATVLVVSLIPPLIVGIAGEDRIAGATWTAVGLLVLIHFAVAASCMTLLPRAEREPTGL
jgi:hypothetical protein